MRPGCAGGQHHRPSADVGEPRAIAGRLGVHDVGGLAQRLPRGRAVEDAEGGVAERLERARAIERRRRRARARSRASEIARSKPARA